MEQKKKKPFCKRWWFIVIAIIVVIGAFSDNEDVESDDPEQTEVATDTTEESVAESAEESNEEPENETTEAKEVEDEESKENEQIEKINKMLSERVEQTKGWALGTLDADGNPTETGEPNPYYDYALYIREISYDGNNLEMQTDAGFSELSEEQKTIVATQSQNIASTVIGEVEDWETDKYQNRLYLTVFNGENALGHSKILDVNEFKWY